MYRDLIIFGMKKFGAYCTVDDDSCPEIDGSVYFLQDLYSDDDVKVISMQKINGEAGHFSMIEFQNSNYLVCGSKNVHMICSKPSDIERYEGSRFNVAKVVAHTAFELLQTQSHTQSIAFFEFVKKTRVTIVCELLQPYHQHIVDNSHLEETKLVPFAFTAIHVKNTLTALQPLLALKLLNAFGFKTPTFEVFKYSADAFKQHVDEIRGMYNTEGVVCYMVKNSKVFGMLKIKSAWYILSRAMRELVGKVQYSKIEVGEFSDKVKRRFDEINKWLKLDENTISIWKDLCMKFQGYISWIYYYKTNDEYRAEYPQLVKCFLAEYNLTDEIMQ